MPKDTFFNLSQDKQEKIMRSAISEFLSKGFERGNVGEIAKQAGVAKGSMWQYFEDKRELFLYAFDWSMDLLMGKYNSAKAAHTEKLTIYDYLYHLSRETWLQLREEQEIVIFLQDVFLGKFSSVAEETTARIMKASEEFLLELIREGKRDGIIRKDIDDHIICLFMLGASMKIKQYFIDKVISAGESVTDEGFFEAHTQEIKSVNDLLINGMGEK